MKNNMELTFKLENFEGPLDVLLHLIEKNKIDIYDIPIVLITEQYISFIKNLQEYDLDISSEFLLMAATLIEIKTKMLLPKILDDKGDEIDPREDLTLKLIEYRMYKLISNEFKNRDEGLNAVICREKTLPKAMENYKEPIIDLENLLDGITAQTINNVFIQVMKRMEMKTDTVRAGFKTIKKEEISLEDKMSDVRKYAEKKLKNNNQKGFSFKELLVSQNDKFEIIVTFLAVLELIKTGQFQVIQKHIFDDIVITK